MKTITLTEEAYERLKAWKDGPKDSFSQVVLKHVPKRGTFGDLDASLQKLTPLTDEQARVVADAVTWSNDWKNWSDPWAQGAAE